MSKSSKDKLTLIVGESLIQEAKIRAVKEKISISNYVRNALRIWIRKGGKDNGTEVRKQQ